MFIIFLIFLTTVFASSHEKYIDLLPEEEKQEFLDHVARRIMENVESKEDKNKFSRELTDDQLKEHNAFVQSILKEESAQMRRHKGEKENEEPKISEEHLEVKPLQADSPESNNDKIESPDVDQVDLTINDIKRRSFDDSYRESTGDAVKEDVTSESQNLQKRSVETDSTTERSKTDETENVESTTQDLTVLNSSYAPPSTTENKNEYEAAKVKPFGGLSKESDTDESFENVGSLKNNETTTEKLDSTTINAVYNTTTITSETVTNKANKTAGLKPKDSNITYIKSEKKNATVVEPVKETNTSNKTKDSLESSVSDEDYAPNLNDTAANTTLTSTLSGEGTTEDITATTTYKTATESSNVSESPEPVKANITEIVKSETQRPPVLDVATTEDLKAQDESTTESSISTTDKGQIETSASTENTTAIPVTTALPVPALTPTSIEEKTTIKPPKVKAKHGKVKKSHNATLSKIASNALNKLKEKYKKKKVDNEEEFVHFKEVQKQIFKHIESGKECNFPSCKGYRVFEVHWPGSEETQTPFLRDSDPMLNEPYFVPIYNYSPNHVYYNPENRLGPSLVEENSIEISAESLRVGHRQDNEVNEPREFIIDLDLDLMRKFGIYKMKEPKEYKIATHPPTKPPRKKKKTTTTEAPSEEEPTTEATMDFPNSDEDTHPYNSLKGSMKNHIHLIRDVLFQNQHFGDPEMKDHRDYEEFLYGDKKKQQEKEEKEKKDNERKGKKSKGKGGKEWHYEKKWSKVVRSRQKLGNDKNFNIDDLFDRSKKNNKKNKRISYVPRSRDDVKLFFVNLFGSNHNSNKNDKQSRDDNNYRSHNNFNRDRHDRYVSKTVRSRHDKYNNDRNLGNPYDNYLAYNKYKRNKFDRQSRINKFNSNFNKGYNRYNTKPSYTHNRYSRFIRNMRKKQTNNETDNGRMDTIAKILNLTPESDVFINLKKLQDMKVKLMRRNSESKFGQYIDHLKNMVQHDDKALKQYNWLTTTVQIQSALSKLLELVKIVKEAKPIHPSDVQILKYVVFLHNFASEIRRANYVGGNLQKNMKLPSNKNIRENTETDKGLVSRIWLYLKTLMPNLTDEDEQSSFEDFLLDIEDSLYDLHNALKNIARITKYRNQHWYENLKDLYLTTEEKQLKEVLLHISLARLVDLIEYSCRNGLEVDFVEFMKSHRRVAKRTIEEMLFVVKIIDEIKYSSN